MRVIINRGHVETGEPAFTLDFLTADLYTTDALFSHKDAIRSLLETVALIIEEYANGSAAKSAGTDEEVGGGNSAGPGSEESGGSAADPMGANPIGPKPRC